MSIERLKSCIDIAQRAGFEAICILEDLTEEHIQVIHDQGLEINKKLYANKTLATIVSGWKNLDTEMFGTLTIHSIIR